jgi:tetratricopeptide (TPR) repeat protein
MVRYYAWILANTIVLLGATVPTLILPERAIALPGNPVAQPQTSEIDRAITEGMRLFREGSKVSLTAAIQQFEQALKLSQEKGQQAQQAIASIGLGRIYDALGEKTKALEYYNQALLLFHLVGDLRLEAVTLNNIASVYDVLGEKTKALKYYNQASSILHTAGDRSGEATTLNNIGAVYNQYSGHLFERKRVKIDKKRSIR